MSESSSPSRDRWWVYAVLAAIGAMLLTGFMIFRFFWAGTWIAAVGVLVFVAMMSRHPDRWYRRLAGYSFIASGTASVLPSVDAIFFENGMPGRIFVDHSPTLSIAFLVFSGCLCFLEFRRETPDPTAPSQTLNTVHGSLELKRRHHHFDFVDRLLTGFSTDNTIRKEVAIAFVKGASYKTLLAVDSGVVSWKDSEYTTYGQRSQVINATLEELREHVSFSLDELRKDVANLTVDGKRVETILNRLRNL